MKQYAPLVIFLVALPLLALGPVRQAPPTHWALIVGISDYVHFGDEAGGDLPGAERDARIMRDVLVERWGFPVENVRLLLSREATKEGITEAITEWLPARARPGDNVLVFFAGHGSQMWDESGDEDDGLDETIAPADVDPLSFDFDISDDQMGEWLAALPTDNVIVILDNCNSGTGTREVTPFSRTRRLGREPSAVPRPPSVGRRALPGQEDETGFDAGSGRVLELAAAQPNQAAVDAYFPAEEGGEAFHGGAFTTFLVRELWRAPAEATYEDAFLAVREALKRNRFEQDPYLSQDVAMKTSPLFAVEGGRGAAPDASLRIGAAADQGRTTELAGGQAFGVTTGSLFRTGDGALLLVESVTPERARAEVVEGSVDRDEKARLVGYRFPVRPLRVAVGGMDSETLRVLREAARETGVIELVEAEGSFAHVLLRRRGDVIRVVGMDGAVRAGFPVGPGGTADLVAHLEKEAAAKRLADMENPAPSFELRVGIQGESTAFGIGESVVFRAVSERDGYLTLVDLGTDGTVTVLFPNPYDRDNRVRGGQEVTFPTPGMESEIRAQSPAGRGMVRAFLTPAPLDLPLGDDFTSGEVTFADEIAEAVRAAAGDVARAPEAVRLDTWASASVIYDIRP